MRFDLDSSVHCADAAFGTLADVVIDPSTRRLTHLIVRPHDREDLAVLVVANRAGPREGSDGVSLDGTVAEISQLEPVPKTAYLGLGESPVEDPGWDVGIQEMSALPDYGSLGPEALGAGMPGVDIDQHVVMSYHRVPEGTVEISRASPVSSADGDHLGHVVGFVVDDEQQIAHLVLEHGHLWGKHKVAIRSSWIARFETDAVGLSLSKEEVGALKPLAGDY
jgi:hypothetical protein